jgi:hypothetical protein
MKYKVLAGINNDKTGNRYEIGEEFDNGVEGFSEEVIIRWIAKGVLGLAKDVPPKATRKVTLKGKGDK